MTSAGLRGRKKIETARRLASCAYALARDRGVDAVTTDEIAAAAGYSRRTVANYFDGKAEAVVDGFFLTIGFPGQHLRHPDTVVTRPPVATVDDLLDLAEHALREVLGGPVVAELHAFARLVHDSTLLRPYLLGALRDLVLETFKPDDVASWEAAELLLGAIVGLVAVILERLANPGERCAALEPHELDALLERAFGFLRTGFATHAPVR